MAYIQEVIGSIPIETTIIGEKLKWYKLLTVNQKIGGSNPLSPAMEKLKVEDKSSGVDFSGKVFVITGSLVHYKNRDELVSVIEQLGGKVSGSVSAKTSYLINNDVNSTSSKNQTAKSLGVEILSETDFIETFGIA